jgi:hypothetical protein
LRLAADAAAARAAPLLLLLLLGFFDLFIFPVRIVYSIISFCIIICYSACKYLRFYTHACILILGVSFAIAADSDSICIAIHTWLTAMLVWLIAAWWPGATTSSCCMV